MTGNNGTLAYRAATGTQLWAASLVALASGAGAGVATAPPTPVHLWPEPAACRWPTPGLRQKRAALACEATGQCIRVYLTEALWDILVVKEADVAKTLIDVNEEYLAAAQQVLHTQTKKDTVNAALREVTALAARRRDLQRLTSGGLPDLEDEDVMRAAWQR